jgi:4-carboxymuconolactone decarboxylase
MGAVSDFAMPIQHIVTEVCWGAIWTRPGLEQRFDQSLILLTALNRSHELAVGLLIMALLRRLERF